MKKIFCIIYLLFVINNITARTPIKTNILGIQLGEEVIIEYNHLDYYLDGRYFQLFDIVDEDGIKAHWFIPEQDIFYYMGLPWNGLTIRTINHKCISITFWFFHNNAEKYYRSIYRTIYSKYGFLVKSNMDSAIYHDYENFIFITHANNVCAMQLGIGIKHQLL